LGETFASFDGLWCKLQTDLRDSTNCASHIADLWIVELCRFLLLKVLVEDGNDTKLAPSKMVLRAWHCLLLYPADYLALNSALLRNATTITILDHNPRNHTDEYERAQRYAETLSKYRELFNLHPEDAYWEHSDFPLQQTANGGVGSSHAPLEKVPAMMSIMAVGVEFSFVGPAGETCCESASTSYMDPITQTEKHAHQSGGSGGKSSAKTYKRSRSNVSSDLSLSLGDGEDKEPASAQEGTTKLKKGLPCRPVPMNSTAAAPSGQMHIKIIDEDLQGTCFAVEPTTKFEKLKRAFAEHSGRKEKDLTLYFNGWSLKKSQCATDVDMSDSDCIQVLPRGWPGS
jgi:hypothetical protein